jgi:DUF4097 and DUF4098 domain-containing protein YvlB
MLLTLAALAGLALAQETDTTFAVQPGTRLEVDNFGGEIAVRAWTENRVRIRASHSSRDRVEISYGAGQVSVSSVGRRGPSQIVEYDITVPQWMALNLSGTYTDMAVEGTNAAVSAETVEGDITLKGGGGTVTLRSVEGGVTITDTRGRVDANSVEGEIRISGASGEIVAETVDGDIVLERIESASVEANTVDGDIYYDGAVRDNGRYHFATHDGDLTVSVPERANVTVSVATFNGEFDASFPVQITEQRKRRFTLTIGSGSARLELESFDGDIRLRRPGHVRDGDHDEHQDKDYQ